jgi:hypothetical protein
MFSLGITVYELLTGQRPFVGRHLPEVVGQILNATPAPASTLRSEIDPKVDALLLRMLAKNTEDRHASWADLALDIAEAGRLSNLHQDIPDSDKYQALRSVPLLAPLDDAEIWELVHAGCWRRIAGDASVVREGQDGRSLFFLASGEVKVTKRGRLLGVLRKGEYFGEMAYLKKGCVQRQATVEALTDAVVAEFEPEALEKTSVNCRFHLADVLLDLLVERLQVANQRLLA